MEEEREDEDEEDVRKMIQGNTNPRCKHKNEDDDALSLVKASVGGPTT